MTSNIQQELLWQTEKKLPPLETTLVAVNENKFQLKTYH